MEDGVFLSKTEEDETLMRWNNTYKEYPLNKCLHELIEEQVSQNPNNSAVRFKDKQISFTELNEASNRCARYLRSVGIGANSIVGVLMERSIEMVVALLGIIKAGGAYLPLDPIYPDERLMFMLEDAGVSIVFTQERYNNLIRGFVGTKFCLDSEWDYLSKESGSNLERVTSPENIAYVIYTSGSTGKPKGCMLPHKAICNRLLWMQDKYQLTSQDKVLQKTPFTFDVSVWEFFWPLLSGACLVMAKPEGHKDSNYLVDIINKENITTCHFVPSMFRHFVSNPSVSKCHTLRQVFTSGEALSYDLMIDFKKKLTAKLHNLYGPTEAAVDVTYWECEERRDKKVPIGRPISNIQIYILDAELKQVPIGHEGELHIGGIGLAKGYLNRPELTAEKFIDNPYSTEVGAKLYKTGDKARYLPDGNIEYLGRIDFQVKLRGNRIELGEIEMVLKDHESIEEAVVLVKDEESGDPKLVAYIIVDGKLPASKEIREFVKSKLPSYMVPNIIVPLDSLPVTQHGKLDRKVLPWPVKERVWEGERINKIKSETRVRTNISNELIEYFERVLDTTGLTFEDDLFDLGATSLTMVQMVEKVQEQYGISIPIEVFLSDPTIKNVVDYVYSELEDKGDELRIEDKSIDYSDNLKNKSATSVPANISNELIEYFERVLDTTGLTFEDDLFDLGATSLTMVQMVEKVQEQYGISIPIEVFLSDPTIKNVVDYVYSELEDKGDELRIEDKSIDYNANLVFNIDQLTTRKTTVDNKSINRDMIDNDTSKTQDNQYDLQTSAKQIETYSHTADAGTVIKLNKVSFKESSYTKGAIVRNYTKKEISFDLFSRFLSLLKQATINEEARYLYPSAGGLNAIQTYIYIKDHAIEGINRGIYYYCICQSKIPLYTN
ncbi:amino acid adenylation domain-containing protein [Clostridium formicaceticum]|uniref:Tyrocidine synthase 3 n=1 Tax=Clostridium formicaceticum TaxID=1497 RepID=A0AAC9WGE3_9CLOT|nr:amino acid adenylation domain-containing protein [Clostridium formicaceticum]AOY76256.1 hypothetical protein BJL90_10295 [Clostridium formicaceticum]ARE86640.1 Tyrocidine synthase 3 [Clostridium formicaceticum]